MNAAFVLTEPDAAYAAARCLTARSVDRGRWTTSSHPSRCGWCDIPTDVLDGMICGYRDLSDYDLRNGTNASGAPAFSRLPSAEQAARIRAAQALEDVPPPGPVYVAATAIAVAGMALAEDAAHHLAETLADDPPPAAGDPGPGAAEQPSREPGDAVAVATPAKRSRPSWAGGPS